VVAVARGGNGPDRAVDTPDTPTPQVPGNPPDGVIPDPSTAPFGLTARPSLAPLNFPTQPNLGPLTLDQPIDPEYTDKLIVMLPLPATNNLTLLAHQTGEVELLNLTSKSAAPFINLVGRILVDAEQGLLGMAIDPGFSSNRYFYLHYSINVNGTPTARVSRFTANADLSGASLDSERIIFQTSYQSGAHKAGALAFDSAGNLYIALGDDQNRDNAQNLGSYFGKVLRIRVNNSSASPAYTVPSDNPFVSTSGARPEIWALGFRNPFKLSIDGNDIWVGDVGEESYEELNLVQSGRNYGWPYYEGTEKTTLATSTPASAFTMPYFQYDHGEGQCIIAGFVYRGSAIPALVGQFIYGDFVQGTVHAVKKNADGSFTKTLISSEVGYFAGFGVDAQNEIYALSGGARKIITNGTTNEESFPALLSSTGLFSDTRNLTPQAGLIKYEVNSALWSDDSIKTRWLGVPNGQRISFSAQGNWSFPAGTVLIKHFDMEMRRGDPSSRKRLETRVLVAQVGGSWRAATYRWNNAQTDADLLETGGDETLSIVENGATRQQPYHYPSATECMACHTQASGRVLGVRSEQLNKDVSYTNATDNQLRSLNHIGLFNYNIGAPSQYPALSALDSDASLEKRARSYLASNCSFCHQANGPTPVGMDFRYSTTLAAMNAINIEPQSNLDISNARIIAPGNKTRSLVYVRMNSRNPDIQMPPLGSSMVHGEGVSVIGQWIDSLQ